MAKVLDQKMFFSINRNHQDEITFNKISTYWAPLLEHLFQCFLITLVTFIFDSFMLTLFMQVEILFLNCFIITLVTLITSCWACVLLRDPFRVPLTHRSHLYVSTPVCLYLMCHLNVCYELP